jgi:uncharacterized protein YecA (UPF0149 family)
MPHWCRKPNAGGTMRDPKNPTSWGKVGRNEDCPCGSGKKFEALPQQDSKYV